MDKNLEERINSRWWETKARTELSFSLKAKNIELIYSFVPFQDSQIPCQLLATRDNSTLESILASVGDTRKVRSERKHDETYQSDMEIYSLRLAEELVRVWDAKHASSTPESAWSWKWEIPHEETNAEAISSQISSVFCTIVFSDWIKISLGYEVESLSKLMRWMICTRNICRRCLSERVRLRRHYERLERELRPLHPWAHWLLTSSLRPFDATSNFTNYSSLVPCEDSAELLDGLPVLLSPIRELFAKKEQGLTELLENIPVLNSRFLHNIVRENDWTRPLSSDFSLRKRLSLKDLAGFALSITENDSAYFNRVNGTDFQTISSGRLDPIDKRLLEFGDDVRACVMADADLVGPVSEVTMHLCYLRNFASATAALAALKSVEMCPKQVSKFWSLIGSTWNHWSYRLEYLRAPALPCPTPHVRELECTQQPQTVLAEISRFKTYLALRDERSTLGIQTAPNQVMPEYQTSDMLCLVCKQRRSEHDGLRLKCTECYRHERTRRRLSIADPKVRKNEERASEVDERPMKRIRFAPITSQDLMTSSSQTFELNAQVVDNSRSFMRPTASQLRNDAVARYSTPPTPPRTPPPQTTISLPHIDEFDAGLARLRASRSHIQSNPQLLPSRDSERKYVKSTTSKMCSNNQLLNEDSTGDGSALGGPSPPPLKIQPGIGTTNPSLGDMSPEAAQATGLQFHSPPQGEAIETSVPSRRIPAIASSSRGGQNCPAEPQAADSHSCIPVALTEGRPPNLLGKVCNVSHPRNEAVWWRVFEPSASQVTTKIIPQGRILRPHAFQHEKSEAALDHPVKQSEYEECDGLPSPNIEAVRGFTPVNQVHSARSIPIAQPFSPTNTRLTTFTGSTLIKRRSVRPLSNPIQERYQQSFKTVGGLPDVLRPLKPFPSQSQCSRTANTAISQFKPSVEGLRGAQEAEVLPSPFCGNKGKAKLVEMPAEVLKVRSASPKNESFEDSIRSTARAAMELVNIHDTC